MILFGSQEIVVRLWRFSFENDMGAHIRLFFCIECIDADADADTETGTMTHTPLYVRKSIIFRSLFFHPILLLCAICFHHTELSVSYLNDI